MYFSRTILNIHTPDDLTILSFVYLFPFKCDFLYNCSIYAPKETNPFVNSILVLYVKYEMVYI